MSSDCTLFLGKSEHGYTIEEKHARLLEDYKIVFLSGEKSEREDPSLRLLSTTEMLKRYHTHRKLMCALHIHKQESGSRHCLIQV